MDFPLNNLECQLIYQEVMGMIDTIGIKAIFSSGRSEIRKIFNDGVSTAIELRENSILKHLIKYAFQNQFYITLHYQILAILIGRLDYPILKLLIEKQVIIVYPAEYTKQSEISYSGAVKVVK